MFSKPTAGKIDINNETETDKLITSKIDKKKNEFLKSFTFTEELKCFVKLLVPIALANLMEFVPQYAAWIFIGHLDNSQQILAGAGLARTFTNVCAVAPAWGLSLGLGIVVPQTIGAGEHRNIAIYFQQALICCSIMAIPVSILQYFGGDIMCLIGQDPSLCPIVSSYCRVLIPYIWGMIFLSILQRIIRPLKFNFELLYILLFTGLFSIPLNYILVIYLDFGYIATAVTMDICLFMATFLSMIMLIQKNYGFIFKPLPLSRILEWKGIKSYLALSLPNLVQASMGWWVSEMVTLLSGYCHNPSLVLSATMTVLTLNSIGIVLNVASSQPLSIRFGGHIGAASLSNAKRSVKVGFTLSTIILSFQIIILLIFRKQLPRLLINDIEVANLASSVIYLLIFRQISFNIYMMLSSIYRGLGKPLIPAITAPICHFGIGFTIDIILLFYFNLRQYSDIGIYIIWGCVSFSYFLIAVFITILQVCRCVKWENAVYEAQKRIQHTKTMTSSGKRYGSTQTN